jgi:uncharacterized protein YbjT (DUF2867 family)
MRVVVVGAHGRTGSLVVARLAATGHDVVGTVRRPDHADRLQQVGARSAVVDLMAATPTDLDDVVRGADAVVYAAGSGYGSPGEVVDRLDGTAISDTADAAARAGVHRFLVISAHRTDEDFGPPSVQRLLRAKRTADAHVRATDLAWTVLRPDALTDDPPSGRVSLDAQVPKGLLPRADLAAVVVTALTGHLAVRRQLEVTGGHESIRAALIHHSQPWTTSQSLTTRR